MRKTVEELGIRYLVHFTAAENLKSILTHGIVSRKDLIEQKFLFEWNDNERWDGCINASCFSIGFPNYKMFYPARTNSLEKDWVVLGIRKRVLWEKECAFCTENAAKNSMSSLTIKERSGKEALKKLFDNFPNKPSRTEMKIASHHTTNPQAEVLIFDTVEVDNIFEVAFENEETMIKYKHVIPEKIKVSTKSSLFKGRADYEFWR